jgi:hypothetical protein
MSSLLFGIVERIHPPNSTGPRARLRPLFEASRDKFRWLETEEEFPNSGIVSWWQPPADLLLNSAWQFQTEQSPYYDPNKPQHDYFRVRGNPSVPIELVDLDLVGDEEELRDYLLRTGISTVLCNSRRVVLRVRSGSLVGPIELVLRDEHYYADEKELDQPIAVSQPRTDLSLAEISNHRYLPLEGWSIKLGELDYSSNEVFLKRVLKDLRKITPSVVDDVKLTDKLITRYCASVGTASLTAAQRHRFRRLQRIAAQARVDVNIPVDALDDFLEIGTIAELLEQLKAKTKAETIAAVEASLASLHAQRDRLDREFTKLKATVVQKESELVALEQKNALALEEFDTRTKERFRNLSMSASGFLADIALIRAALNLNAPKSGGDMLQRESKLVFSDSGGSLTTAEFDATIKNGYKGLHADRTISLPLLCSLAAGFFPIVFGPHGREALNDLACTVAAARLFSLPLNATLTSPTNLRSEILIHEAPNSSQSLTLDELLHAAGTSSNVSILVLENINLAQIDSVILPLIRQYVERRSRALGTGDPTDGISTPVGSWPANLWLAGFAIDSPLSLPVSTELWSYATFVYPTLEKPTDRCDGDTSQPNRSKATQISHGTWIEWLTRIDRTTAEDPMMLAEYVAHKIGMSPLLKRLTRNLASTLASIGASTHPSDRLRALAELTIVPYALSLGANPRLLFEGCPIAVPDSTNIDRIESIFKRWGIEPTSPEEGEIRNA